MLLQCGEREKELNFPIVGRLGAGRYDGCLGFLAGASGERGGGDLGDDFVDLADGGLQLRGAADFLPGGDVVEQEIQVVSTK